MSTSDRCARLVLLVVLIAAPAATRAEADRKPVHADSNQSVAASPSGYVFLGPEDGSPRRALDGSDPGPWRGEPISLSLKDADLREVLRSFAKLTAMNLVLHPEVRGKVTVELENVPWDQALYVLLKTHDLGIEIDGNIWAIDQPRRR